MKIRLLDEAECDLDEGRDIYDGIEAGEVINTRSARGTLPSVI